jgi:hypothetical protein
MSSSECNLGGRRPGFGSPTQCTIDAGYRADRERQFDLARARGLTSPGLVLNDSEFHNRKE